MGPTAKELDLILYFNPPEVQHSPICSETKYLGEQHDVPGRMQSQRRSLRWSPDWPPSPESPWRSSPAQQRNKDWLLDRLWAKLVTLCVASTHLKSLYSMTDLKPHECWCGQWTHCCVHLTPSLVDVFQGLLWALGVVFTAADRDALCFKVIRLAPVSVISHPAAMQLRKTSRTNFFIQQKSTSKECF